MTNVVRATVRKIANVGKVLDAGLDAGANNVQGVSFGLEKRAPAEETALTEAVREARRKAEAMARAAGVRLGSILEINSAFEGRPMPMAGFGGEMAMARVATPVSPGELDVNANVTLIFAIQPGDPAYGPDVDRIRHHRGGTEVRPRVARGPHRINLLANRQPPQRHG